MTTIRICVAATVAYVCHAHFPAYSLIASGAWMRPDAPDGVTSRDVNYTVDGVAFQGFAAFPKDYAGRRPGKGVLIAHQFGGLGDYEKARAEEMAGMGYVAFALDYYGNVTRAACKPHDPPCLMNISQAYYERTRRFISLGTQQLLKLVETQTPVAFGYCLGGQVVLELARHPGKGASDGVTYAAVSSIHGILPAFGGEKASKGEIQTMIQVHHGQLDFQGDGALATLEAELEIGVNGSKAAWETTKYAKCKHGFTMPGPSINARANVQSHKSTFEFFEEALKLENVSKDAFPIMPFCQAVGPSSAFVV